MSTQEAVIKLRGAIRELAELHLSDSIQQDYRQAVVLFCELSYADLVLKLIRKQAAGQDKYGGNFFDANHDAEAEAEVLDLINYTAATRFLKSHPEVKYYDVPTN